MSFDPKKESFHVVNRRNTSGGGFKSLEVVFDGELTMERAVKCIVAEAQWKLRTSERSSKFQCNRQLVLLYKARVLSYVEYRNAAIYHGTDTVLEPLNKVQDNFLKRLGVPELNALMDPKINLAPLQCRRDIAMLGVVHRAVLKEGPKQLWEFFEVCDNPTKHSTRISTWRHNRQLKEHRKGRFLEILRRSALGLVGVYNLLPGEIVEQAAVKDFQTHLTKLLKERASSGREEWKDTFSPRVPMWRHPLQ